MLKKMTADLHTSLSIVIFLVSSLPRMENGYPELFHCFVASAWVVLASWQFSGSVLNL
jgi:hypothetical protein